MQRTNELLNQIENVNAILDNMTIHAIHNTARGEYLQNRLEKLREELKKCID